MPWTPLSDRWNQVPLILAGPILRRVEANLVTVWVAVKSHQEVTLLVFDESRTVLFTGTRETEQLGPGVHVVTVTARPPAGQPLQPGRRYQYNLGFGVQNLWTPGVVGANYNGQGKSLLGYGADDALPSFSLPPADPAELRIIHGSCRRAQGDDRDALEALDELIEASAADPNARPHHLILTGDQLYCDNVPEALLYEYIQANGVLFGRQETILGLNVTADRLPAASRTDVVSNYCGQEHADPTFKRSHLLTLSEFVTHYLYMWSDVLWPARGNWADQATARAGEPVPGVAPPKQAWGLMALFAADPAKEYEETIERVEYLRDGIPSVRRALANVPTLMTFDDHDFTDSWSITYRWTRGVLDSPYGRIHMRNAILAYALCQGWGNRPDDFEPGQPGADLFEAARLWIANGGDSVDAETTLTALVGPNEPEPVGDGTYQLTPPVPPAALRWDYVIDYPTHRIMSLDGRTHCGYADAGNALVGIIGPTVVADQIPVVDNPPPITFAISGAPVVGYGFLEAGQELTAKLLWPSLGNAEEWVYHLPAQQSLLARLAHAGAPGTTLAGLPGRRTRIVMLSGDVHFGYTARLQYWGERPYGHATQSPVDMVVAQLVASAFKNERPQTDSWHRDGMSAFEGPSTDRWSVGPAYISQGLGWSNDSGADVQVGMRAQPFNHPAVPVRISGRNQVRYTSPDSDYAITSVTVPPDFAFRADWVVDPRFYTLDKPGEIPVEELEEIELDIELHDPNDANVAQSVEVLDGMIESRLARIAGASIVGRNQFGEITLTYRDGEPVAVTHGIYWRELRVSEEAATGQISPVLPLTVATVSLEFDEVARPFG